MSSANTAKTSLSWKNQSANPVTIADIAYGFGAFIVLVTALVVMFAVMALAQWEHEARVQGEMEPSREEFARMHRYHGINHSYKDAAGWHFYRDGRRCKLFKEGM